MKSLVHTQELCSRSLPLEHAPGAKSLVCIGLYAQDVSQGIKVTPYFIPSSPLLNYFRVLIIATRFVWSMVRTKATLRRSHAI